jgi:N-acetylglucosamine-6-sulfatase
VRAPAAALARRAAIAVSGAVLGLGLLLGGGSVAAGPADPPNVVVVMTDDQRTSDMAVLDQTRRLIGREGVRFTRSFASFPLCCPSRATHQTGLYAHNHGVQDNNPPNGGAAVFRDSGLADDTVAVALQNAGYQTALFGKYMNGYPSLATADPPYIPPGFTRWAALAAAGRMFNWKQIVDGRIVQHGFDERDYQTDVLARQASRFVRENGDFDLPFFVTVSPLAPHVETRFGEPKRNPRPAKRHRTAFLEDPLVRTPAFNEADVSDKPSEIQARFRLTAEDRQGVRARANDRRASLLAVDDMVAKLVDTLRETGELRDTLFVFTSDNGFLLGEHRISAGKNSAYDEAARVPLLVRGPGIPDRTQVSSPVVNVDVPATIYDVTGVQPAIEQDGVSLAEVASDPAEFADRDVLIETTDGAGLRTPDFLYVEHGTPPTEFELYDLGNDPFQLDSVHDAPGYADERQQLNARLAQLDDCEGDECY